MTTIYSHMNKPILMNAYGNGTNTYKRNNMIRRKSVTFDLDINSNDEDYSDDDIDENNYAQRRGNNEKAKTLPANSNYSIFIRNTNLNSSSRPNRAKSASRENFNNKAEFGNKKPNKLKNSDNSDPISFTNNTYAYKIKPVLMNKYDSVENIKVQKKAAARPSYEYNTDDNDSEDEKEFNRRISMHYNKMSGKYRPSSANNPPNKSYSSANISNSNSNRVLSAPPKLNFKSSTNNDNNNNLDNNNNNRRGSWFSEVKYSFKKHNYLNLNNDKQHNTSTLCTIL